MAGPVDSLATPAMPPPTCVPPMPGNPCGCILEGLVRPKVPILGPFWPVEKLPAPLAPGICAGCPNPPGICPGNAPVWPGKPVGDPVFPLGVWPREGAVYTLPEDAWPEFWPLLLGKPPVTPGPDIWFGIVPGVPKG